MWVLPFRKLAFSIKKNRLPIFACIAILMLLLQWLTSHSNQKIQEYLQVLELAQRQKLISQQMINLALHIDRSHRNPDHGLHQMAIIKHEWAQLHFNPQFGNQYLGVDLQNRIEVQDLIHKILPHYEGITDAINEFLMIAHVEELRNEVIHELSKHEVPFLYLMDKIISASKHQMQANLSMLERIRIILSGLSFLGLLLLIFQEYVFFTYGLAQAIKKKKFFTEQIAEEYLSKHDENATQNTISKEYQKIQDNPFQNIHSDQHLRKSPIARVLIIFSEHLSIDYLAWFLNRFHIDFIIVHSIPQAQDALSTDTFDMLMISDTETHQLNTLKINIPVINVHAKDIKEIHALIVDDNFTDADLLSSHHCQLYHKINNYLPKDKMRL